ncbi:MAG: stalk domain-containing protein [Acidobacteriota bacterium]
MKKLRIIAALATAICLVLVSQVSLFGAPSNVQVAKFFMGKRSCLVNGVGQAADAAPCVVKGTTMISLRCAVYAVGLTENDFVVSQSPAGTVIAISRPYVQNKVSVKDVVYFTVGKSDFYINSPKTAGKLEAPVQIIGGKAMMPFRSTIQALGGLCYGDPKEKSITVVTWVKPLATPQQVTKKLVLRENDKKAVVTGIDGKTRTISGPAPACIGQPPVGWMLDAVQYLKLWGVPAESVFYDPVRGGLMMRGMNGPGKATYIYFYTGQKQALDSLNRRYPDASQLMGVDPFRNSGGKFLAGRAVLCAPELLFGGRITSEYILEKQTLNVEWK